MSKMKLMRENLAADLCRVKPAEGGMCCSHSCLALPQPFDPNGATVQQLDRCGSARHAQETASSNGKTG